MTKSGLVMPSGWRTRRGASVFFLHCAVAEAISEVMRGHGLSWNVPRGEEGRVLFFWLQGVVLIRRWGSDFFFCWIILLVLRSCWLGGAANCGRHGGRCAFARRSHVAALGGRCACAHPPPTSRRFPSGSPNLGVPIGRGRACAMGTCL